MLIRDWFAGSASVSRRAVFGAVLLAWIVGVILGWHWAR